MMMPTTDSPTRWYVMIHRKPQWIDAMLRKESRGELLTPEQRDAGYVPTPFDYYVPYLYMRADATDELRSIFHSFVFIKASPQRIREIVGADWNTRTRLRLHPYRSKSGKEITISEREYTQLRELIHNSQLHVFFGASAPSVRDMKAGNRVFLQIQNWENHPGIIESIKVKKSGVSIRVTFTILGQTQSVSFDDLHDGDVTFADQVTEQLVTDDLIENFEREVSILLSHRFGKSPTAHTHDDAPRLRRLLSYADIHIDDAEDQQRFHSLMLICATLLPDRALAADYCQQLQRWLTPRQDPLGQPPQDDRHPLPHRSHPQLTTYTEAYITLALFIHTRDPRLRDAVKAYRKQHPDTPPILGTLLNKVRDIRCKK